MSRLSRGVREPGKLNGLTLRCRETALRGADNSGGDVAEWKQIADLSTWPDKILAAYGAGFKTPESGETNLARDARFEK
jgi:hypothetical protein